jgi:TonB family protein
MTLSLLLLAAVADPAALVPSGKWQVDYAEATCTLSRDYGAGADKVTLEIRTVPTGLGRDVILVTAGTAASDRGTSVIALSPGGQSVAGTFMRGSLSGGAGQLATIFVPDAVLDGLDQASAIDVRLGDEHHRLALPGIAGAMKALSKCQDDLLSSWGIDPAERLQEAAHVTGNPGRFFGVTAYPVAAVQAHAQGRVISVVGVDPHGGVTSCKVVVSSGNKALDDGTCDIIRGKAHFTPAHDRAGNGVASHYILPVRWSLPQR